MANSRLSSTSASTNANPPTKLDFKKLDLDNYIALINFYQNKTALDAGAYFSDSKDSYQLPAYIGVKRLNVKSQTDYTYQHLENVILNTDAENNNGLTPGNHYLSVTERVICENNCPVPEYTVCVITVTEFVPIIQIDPNKHSEKSRQLLVSLLTDFQDCEIFKPNRLYRNRNSNGLLSLLKLDDYIVKYARKNKSAYRYAVSGKELGHGNQGTVYLSNQTLFLQSSTLFTKIKLPHKQRVIKVGNTTDDIYITHNISRSIAEHEYTMMALMPELFHPKKYANDSSTSLSALISRYFDGRNLHDLLFSYNNPRLNLQQRLEIAYKIAVELQQFHKQNIIHRDLKPENIVIKCNTSSNEMDAFIIDVGLSISIPDAQIGGGYTVGTPDYAAPETWKGKKSTTAADVFALGRIFWELILNTEINNLIRSIQDAQKATIPIIDIFFGGSRYRPDYAKPLYDLLVKMNAPLPEKRIKLDAVIEELEAIQQAYFPRPAQTGANDSAGTSAAAAASTSTTGLFAAAQSTPKTGSDDGVRPDKPDLRW